MAARDQPSPPTAPLDIGVVVPTLDELESLRQNLEAILATGCPVVVSDGGSLDGTTSFARACGAQLVSGSPSRGSQLNRGAAALDNAVLLFLHADTRLPEGALSFIRQAIAQGAIGGGFALQFDDQAALLRLAARLISARTRLTRAPLGDQAQFVLRHDFQQLGGFRDWPILEDLDFALRLKRHGRVAILPAAVTTSARRYRQRGVLRNAATNWLIFALYFLGVSPQRLARLYDSVR